MKEYTLLAVVSVVLVLILDLFLKVRIILNKAFWIFWMIMFVIIFVVNGYLTARPVVLYGSEYFSGIRLFTIPIEDFLYGFSLITSNIIIWEYFSRKHSNKI
jgi:lycopene cyclase domain-containing protein